MDGTLVCIGNPKELTQRHGGYYIFTITVPPEQEAEAEALVRRLAPGARLAYALAGTRKYELPVEEVTLPGARQQLGCACGMAGCRALRACLEGGRPALQIRRPRPSPMHE